VFVRNLVLRKLLVTDAIDVLEERGLFPLSTWDFGDLGDLGDMARLCLFLEGLPWSVPEFGTDSRRASDSGNSSGASEVESSESCEEVPSLLEISSLM
jgi:hypothetical protein